MTDFKVGDRVRRVRNSSGIPDEGLSLRMGQKMRIERISYGALFGDKGGVSAMADDCELVEPSTCTHCGQPLPERITVPEHTLPWHLTEEPEEGADVWAVTTVGPAYIEYDPDSELHQTLLGDGWLYATEADAQDRYDRITAPTRRRDDGST